MLSFTRRRFSALKGFYLGRMEMCILQCSPAPSRVVIRRRWSWLPQGWAVTNTGYWFSSSEVISSHLLYGCLCNCPHYPPQPQLVWLMPRRREEHMHQRARCEHLCRIRERWNLNQPVYFARGLCRCITIYLLQQDSDGGLIFLKTFNPSSLSEAYELEFCLLWIL